MNISNKQVNDQSMLSKDSQPVSLNEKAISSIEYQKPILISYGDVRDITLGPSPGVGESGSLVLVLRA